MKYAIIALLFTSLAFSQQGGIFSISPDHPKVGDEITITYAGDATGAQLKDAKEMDVQGLVYQSDLFDYDNQPFLIEASMKQEGTAWKGFLTLDQPRSKYILFRFRSSDKTDDNGGKCWESFVYNKDDKPVREGHLSRGMYHAGQGYFIFSRSNDVKDLSVATDELQQERVLYPDDWVASEILWNLEFPDVQSDSARTLAEAALDKLYARFKDDETALYKIYTDYNRVGDSTRAKQIRSDVVSRDSKGEFARRASWGDIFQTARGSSERSSMMEKHLAGFSGMEEKEKEMKLNNLVNAYTDEKNYDKAYEVLSHMKKKNASVLNELAWAYIEKGKQLEKATGWAKEGVELRRTPDISTKPSYVSKKDWESNSKDELGGVLDTYAYGLYQLGKTGEAEKNYDESYQLMKGSDPEANERYVECLMKNKKYDKAIEVGSECVKNGKSNLNLLEEVKEALVGDDGSAGDYAALSSEKKKKFEALMTETKKAKSDEIRKKVQENRISKSPVDFTLKDLDGKPVSLSSLKGKVVVIDFWATWCGPCRQSFPFFQKVYEKYKSNEKVVFLAIDTRERVKDYDATVANAKSFIEFNKYTFTVLIDEITGTRVSEKYEVDGIPTKFIFDKKGNIAFKSIGFEGPEMEEEMTQEIELLLAESIGSLN